MNATKIRSIRVGAKKWFDRVNGNTYFSADVFVDNELAHRIDFAYGYGSHYLTEAAEWLTAAKVISPERSQHGGLQPLWQYCEENDIELVYYESDVSRKRDL